MVANLAWGGEDFRTLFMTATHSVYTVATKVGPRHEPYMNAAAGSRAAVGLPAAARPSARAASPRSRRCAMIIQDVQNDVITEGGAFADSGAPAHARSQRVVETCAASPTRRARAA